MTDQPLETRIVEAAAAQAAAERSAETKAADHAAIAGSIDELLPALIAKLGATGLAELEIREDGLRVRLRRPPDSSVTHDRRAGDRSGRVGSRGTASAPGGAHAPGAPHAPTGHATGLTPSCNRSRSGIPVLPHPR